MVLLTTYNDLGSTSPQADSSHYQPAGQGSHMGSYYDTTGAREPRLDTSFKDRLTVSSMLSTVTTDRENKAIKPIKDITKKLTPRQTPYYPKRKEKEPIEASIRREQHRRVVAFQPIHRGVSHETINSQYGSSLLVDMDIKAAGYCFPDTVLELYARNFGD